ncbi:hypothetical protein J9874_01074 [Duffyella gerundensis]|uniref:rhamnan synthesis F family protein n=1 Tax=Duffyella gerundensis TaxID=1619313 RepID=UPI0016961878|nr:rhamnan synthesis F family protein [Duffyella gerundensis]UCB30548.1 hypothetical protein J9874_01074 [Duffyella gerundensis]
MKNIIFKIIRFFLKVIIYIYYSILSVRDNIRTKKYSDIKIKNDFAGGKVMLIALYEKSRLRNDTLEVLKEAKKNNIFIIAVNTLKLEEHNYPLDLADVYIERDNYGRDFGSYKAGMKYFFDSGFQEKCERLLIINDSVFFSKKGLPEFIKNLFNNDIEVLGATENSQHSHHLGSFCISVAAKIVRNPKFEEFWENYKNSNVRPLVIKRGEFGLSKTLKSMASSEENFKSIFNVAFMEKKLKSDDELYQNYYYYRREGESAWRNRSVTGLIASDEVLSSYYKKYVILTQRAEKLEFYSSDINKYNVISKEYEKIESGNVDYLQAVEFFKSNAHAEIILNKQFKQRLISIYLEEFTLGSQIHINCLALHNCGLPIIKLDLMFRCVCNMNDILKLRDQLDESQQEEFMTLMLSRLCGDKFLIGINRIAYQFGIL